MQIKIKKFSLCRFSNFTEYRNLNKPEIFLTPTLGNFSHTLKITNTENCRLKKQKLLCWVKVGDPGWVPPTRRAGGWRGGMSPPWHCKRVNGWNEVWAWDFLNGCLSQLRLRHRRPELEFGSWETWAEYSSLGRGKLGPNIRVWAMGLGYSFIYLYYIFFLINYHVSYKFS